MDRCHRLGQDKPVLVLRLATAHSVEGKLLKRAIKDVQEGRDPQNASRDASTITVVAGNSVK